MQKQFADIHGKRIAYHKQGEGPVVVLLHGFCGSLLYWEAVMNQLAERYTVIAPDLRGHGDSWSPVGTYTMESFADDLRDLLHHLHVDRISLFGHSLGGYISLAFASRYQIWLDHLGLIHSTSLPDDEQGKLNRATGIKTIEEQGITPFVDQLITKLCAPGFLSQNPKWEEEIKQMGYETTPEGAIHSLAGMKDRPDRTSVIEELSCPILLMAGSEDKVIPLQKTFLVHRENVTTVLLEGSGHMGMIETPQQWLTAVTSFLEQSKK
ncbi:Alpha/beta hydrolase fold [Brevibacillus laterosporus]|nr:alpha/beta hydrolase [Brevibacillus laterosporus]RAP30982.1 Alpha/beta hydrolase fold [Brevibacillus laterosporus]